MKKLILFLSLTVVALSIMAEGYSSLTFIDADGSKRSFSVTDLVITFDGGSMSAKNNDGSFSMPLSNLVKMAFSDEPTAIENITAVQPPVTAYSLEGLYMGEYNSADDACASLTRGLYILKSNGVTSKISVR